MSYIYTKTGFDTKNIFVCGRWNYTEIIHFELPKLEEAVITDVYFQQLERLSNKLEKKRSLLVNRKRIILQHDKSRPHGAKQIQYEIN